MLSTIKPKKREGAIARVKKTHVARKLPTHDLAALERLHADCLPVEGIADQEVSDAIAAFKLGERFPAIDLSFLRMRRWGNMPTFAVYDVFFKSTEGRGCCFFKGHKDYGNSCSVESSIPWPLHSYFEDVMEEMKRKSRKLGRLTALTTGIQKRSTVQASHYYQGLIPPHVRQIIRAERNVFSHIVLIEEARKWLWQQHVETRRIPRPVYADPLVVGLLKSKAFLLAAFDLEPLEMAIAREYTKGQNPINFC